MRRNEDVYTLETKHSYVECIVDGYREWTDRMADTQTQTQTQTQAQAHTRTQRHAHNRRSVFSTYFAAIGLMQTKRQIKMYRTERWQPGQTKEKKVVTNEKYLFFSVCCMSPKSVYFERGLTSRYHSSSTSLSSSLSLSLPCNGELRTQAKQYKSNHLII